MIGPPPITDDVTVLRDWCEKLYAWITYPDKFEVQFIEMQEQASDVDAPSANRVRIYAKDNGSSKTQLVARFNTGAVQELDVEP